MVAHLDMTHVSVILPVAVRLAVFLAMMTLQRAVTLVSFQYVSSHHPTTKHGYQVHTVRPMTPVFLSAGVLELVVQVEEEVVEAAAEAEAEAENILLHQPTTLQPLPLPWLPSQTR
jgi:hypothetical protein